MTTGSTSEPGKPAGSTSSPSVIYALMVPQPGWEDAAEKLGIALASKPRKKNWIQTHWGPIGRFVGAVGIIGGLFLNALTTSDQHLQAKSDAERAIRDQAMRISVWSDRIAGERVFHLLNSSPDPITDVSVVFRMQGTPIYYKGWLPGFAPCTEVTWPRKMLLHNGHLPSDVDMDPVGVQFRDRSGKVWMEEGTGVLHQSSKVRDTVDWARISPKDELRSLEGYPIGKEASACSRS